MSLTLKEVVDVYKKYYNPSYNELLQRYGSFLNAASYSDVVMAEVLLIGDHQARLNDIRSWRADAFKAIQKLAKDKPWLKKYACFTDIHNHVQAVLSGCGHIGPLTVYDVALRLAAQNGFHALMPDRVYLYAGPLETAKRILGTAMINKHGNVLDLKLFPSEFHVLRCDEVENLLCVLPHLDMFLLMGYGGKKTAGNLLRKNLLAHQLLEVNWGKGPLPEKHLNTLGKKLGVK